MINKTMFVLYFPQQLIIFNSYAFCETWLLCPFIYECISIWKNSKTTAKYVFQVDCQGDGVCFSKQDRWHSKISQNSLYFKVDGSGL